MNLRIKFHFTLANMMLMMVPLGVASACAGVAISGTEGGLRIWLVLAAFVVGISSAVGTLIDGWKGALIGVAAGFIILFKLVSLAIIGFFVLLPFLRH
jgi:hypothetical protein